MKVIDLFSGIGGFSLGLELSGSIQPYFLRLISTLLSSLESGGPASRSIATSQSSQLSIFDLSISSAGASRAKTSALLEKVQGSTGHILGCGGRCGELSTRPDPIGCLLRMLVLSGCEALTQCSMTWRLSATPAGRSWFVLDVLEHRTDGPESGSWATPIVGDSLGCPSQTSRGTVYLNLTGQVYPTPNACDGERGGESIETKKARGAGGINLCQAVNEVTPKKIEGQYPTPKARDWKSADRAQEKRASPDLPTAVYLAGQLHQDQNNTHGSPIGSTEEPNT